MSCVSCSVVALGDSWIAKLASGAVGPYRTRDLALQAAIAEALRIRRVGGAARVSLYDQRGQVSAERCLCTRFPAAG